jgi:hypothetical protein
LFGGTRIRAYGFLNLKDNCGNIGRAELNRTGEIAIRIDQQPEVRYSIFSLMDPAKT